MKNIMYVCAGILIVSIIGALVYALWIPLLMAAVIIVGYYLLIFIITILRGIGCLIVEMIDELKRYER